MCHRFWNSGEPSVSASAWRRSRRAGDRRAGRVRHRQPDKGIDCVPFVVRAFVVRRARAVERRTSNAERRRARERLREIHPRDQRSGIDPRVGGVFVAGRRLALVERHAELLQRPVQRTRVVERRPGGPDRADHELEGRLGLGREGRRRQELGRCQQRAHHLAQVAVTGSESCRQSIDQRRGRRVADEPPRQLGRHEPRRRGMRGEQVEHLLAVLDSAGANLVSEDDLLAIVVNPRFEQEVAAYSRIADRPAGERPRHLGDVLLRVAAVDAERVQLHQLARVVFVEPAPHCVRGGAGGRGRRGR